MAVFAYVLGSLPERVKVYPTENHYYFSFDLNGIRYAGNIKIDARLRAEGKVVFSYYEDRAAWLKDTDGTALVLGASQGVTVEKVEPLAYRVSYGKKSVVFALNDLSQVKPPAAALAPNDQFIGPVFDESGIRFFLVFNAKLKLFHYILDETVKPADVFVPAPVGDGRILIGKRTGFAVYRDQRRDRKILIGVYRDNVLANNYLDGPFDQMPDNFIEGDSFQQAILAVAAESQRPDQSVRQFCRRCALCGGALHGISQPKGPRDLRSLRDQSAHSGGAVRRLLRASAGRQPRRKRAAAGHAAVAPDDEANGPPVCTGGPPMSNAAGVLSSTSTVLRERHRWPHDRRRRGGATELVRPTQLRRAQSRSPRHWLEPLAKPAC